MNGADANNKKKHEKMFRFRPGQERGNSRRQMMNVAGNADNARNSISSGFILRNITRFIFRGLCHQFGTRSPTSFRS